MPKQQLDHTLVRCIPTDGRNRVLHVKKYLTQDETYMKRVKLMPAPIEAPGAKPKLTKAKQKEVDGIDERIKGLEAGTQNEQTKIQIADLNLLKERILNGR